MELIASCDEDRCDNMMCEHLIVIFPAILNMEDKNLLEPKCQLCNIVYFEEACCLENGPIRPHLPEIHPVWSLVVEILPIPSSLAHLMQYYCPTAKYTYHAEHPENGVIHHEPSLLCKSHQSFVGLHPSVLSIRHEYIPHGCISEEGKDNNPVEDMVEVCGPLQISTSHGVLVLKPNELVRY